MNVLVVTPSYSTSLSGQHARINDLLRFHRHTNDELSVDVVPIKCDTWQSTDRQRIHFSGGSRYARAMSALSRAARVRRQADIVHVVDLPPLLGPPLAGVAAGKPLVLGPNIAGRMFPDAMLDDATRQVIEAEKPALRRRWMLYGERFERMKLRAVSVLPSCVSYLSFSDFMTTLLAERGIDRSDVITLPSGVPTDVFTPRGIHELSDPIELLFVGKPTRRKGIQLLVDAVTELKNHDARVSVVGAKTAPSSLQIPATVEDRIRFLGRVPRGDLVAYYRHADAYVIPSYYELESTSMIEALACGTPCIATDGLSFREIGPDDACCYFDRGDAESLAAAIRSLMSDYPLYEAAARRAADQFDISRTYRSLRQLYRRLA